jgi:RNA polymerase sigma-70 factor (ECF subfamily)
MSSEAPAISDEECVRRFRETGDKEWFGELFVRHRRKVYFRCRAFFSDSYLAEDATHEAFLRAYRGVEGFHGGNFASWMMMIARNVCIDLCRQRGREIGFGDVEVKDLPDRTKLDSSVEAKLLAERIRVEMQSLGPEQRRCLEMKIEGYSYEEIAARTGLPVKEVKSHIQNGRRMLWKRMEGVLSRSK